MSKVSQFYKTILLLVLSIVCFLGLKSILPDRLFPESLTSDPSMLIDSVLLDLLGGNSAIELDLTDTIPIEKQQANKDSLLSLPPVEVEKKVDNAVTSIQVENLAVSVNTLKPFVASRLSKKLEKRKPILFIPDSESKYVVEKPIVDTLLDPSISIQGYGYLQRFYSKLKKLEDGEPGRVRVAYFGDSMNDGDLIVQDFRAMLQDEFGGSGVGYVSITSMSSASRGSVYHQHSDAWLTQSFINTKNPIAPFGVDGQVFFARDAGSYWVNYTAGNIKNSPALYNPTLFYGYSESNSGYVNVSVNKGSLEKMALKPEYSVNTINLGSNQAKSVRLNFGNIQNIPIYGLNFSSFTGVHVDNFSIRGNSGLTLVGLNAGLMNAFDRVLNYDLIVLHYGTNVLNYGSHDYSFYERGMTAVINKLRYCFPNADILVVSTADKASKINMKMVTDPAVVALTKAQKSFARETGTGYIDLYNLMGGNGSMVNWVNNQLANKDYTHFNIKGSKEIGSLLFQDVKKGYEKYKIQLAKEIKRSEREN